MTKSHKATLALSVVAAAALALVIGPALMQSASADPAPKTDPSCDDPNFIGTKHEDDCPGKSESSTGDKRDNECTPRNRGHIDDCEALVEPEPGDSNVEDPVNPPKNR
jgi:hypothetical protein